MLELLLPYTIRFYCSIRLYSLRHILALLVDSVVNVPLQHYFTKIIITHYYFNNELVRKARCNYRKEM